MRKITIPGVEGEVDFELKIPQIIAAEREVGKVLRPGPGTMPQLRIDEMHVLRTLAWHGCKGKIKPSDLDGLAMWELINAFAEAVGKEVWGDDAMNKMITNLKVESKDAEGK